ncbi:hypothetical protein E2C01_055593 [Portunus trituberculatus]|uniref:Reverse transcriptase domain-containing protein n=1 Tax=Portunus trituberculatus TaxID=210409 RepID=A0A5B7GMW4_PORTR|nr:hypothetical protein [Portunus trituberculatus]
MYSTPGHQDGLMCFLLLIHYALTNTPHRWKYCTVGVPVNNRDLDYLALQPTLEQLQAWTEENRMIINSSKTVISFGPHRLHVFRSAKLLSATVNDQQIWMKHVTTTVRSAAYRLYMLFRRPWGCRQTS